MASLRFTYYGNRGVHKVKPYVPVWPPRHYYRPPVNRPAASAGQEPDGKEKEKESDIEEKSTSEKDTGRTDNGGGPDIPASNPDRDGADPGQTGKDSADPAFNLSALLINRLDAWEAGLQKTSGQMDTVKTVLDEIIFKLDSFLQILQIIHANEEKRLLGPQATVAPAPKESKDSIDELLELLHTPALQGVIRQMLVGMLVKK